MAGCEPTPEVKAILTAMARAKLKEGHTDPDVILSHIHEAIKDDTGMHKSEIADAIAGVTARKNSASDAAAHMAALRAELRDLQKVQDTMAGKVNPELAKNKARETALKNEIADLDRRIAYPEAGKPPKAGGNMMGPDTRAIQALREERDAKQKELGQIGNPPPAMRPLDPMVRKNAARQTAVKNQIADYERRMAAGDFSKPEKVAPNYSPDTQKWIAARNDAKHAYERALHTMKQENRSAAAKVADMLVEMHRAAVLTSPNILLKLPMAAATNIVSRPLVYEPMGSLIRRLVPGIAAKAPSEGGGFDAGIERAAAAKTFSKQTLSEMNKYRKTGTDQLTSLYGKRDSEFNSDFKLAQIVGNWHGMLKTPAKINAWERSMGQRMKSEAIVARRSGMSEDEVAAHLSDPVTMATVGAKAYADAEREIFQNPNVINTLYNTMLAQLENKGHFASARVARFFLPVTKVPTNVAISAFSHAGGAIGAMKQLVTAGRLGGSENFFRNAVKNLTEDQADSIMRNLKKQGVGLAMMAIGAAYYKNFGGMYQQGDSKNKLKPDTESIKFGNTNISKQFLEHPFLFAMQIGATAAWVAHKPKGDKAAGALAAANGIAEKIPFISFAEGAGKALESVKALTNFAAQQVGSMNPQIVQWGAKALDRVHHRAADESVMHAAFLGKPVKRAPFPNAPMGKQFMQTIEEGVPGLRERVPRKP